MERNFSDIQCPNCSAPAHYDIINADYLCGYCASRVSVKEAIAQKQGFRKIQQKKIHQSAENYELFSANCSGCGAEIIFEEREALTNCAFCGRALVRQNYLASTELPELVIPFRLTEEEAREQMKSWCKNNSSKEEAKELEKYLDQLKGFYLPYELIRGPVSSSVGRMDAYSSYYCRGFIDNVFINCSDQLDNLLLDGMEPFELEELNAFDFSYVAGHRVKIRDLNESELLGRISEEVSNDYRPVVQKTLETKAVTVSTDSSDVLRMPVLLPVYYIAEGKIMAAVNGQTGKVSVQAMKISKHYFMPWWVKALLGALTVTGFTFWGLGYFDISFEERLQIVAMLAFMILLVTLTIYDDTMKMSFRVDSFLKIFTSSGGPMRRVDGKLVQDSKEIQKDIREPIFFEKINGVEQAVQIVFSSPLRTFITLVPAFIIFFLPVIVALFLNGFNFSHLVIQGSWPWFFMGIFVVPAYVIKFGRAELYERPWIYLLQENGRKKRYHKNTIDWFEFKYWLKLIFTTPILFLLIFLIIMLIMASYFTAFGFD